MKSQISAMLAGGDAIVNHASVMTTVAGCCCAYVEFHLAEIESLLTCRTAAAQEQSDPKMQRILSDFLGRLEYWSPTGDNFGDR